MNVHKNARVTPRGRERIVRQVESGQTAKAVTEAAGVCLRTARKWVDRYRREGLAGLQDRSSRPHRIRLPTPVLGNGRLGDVEPKLEQFTVDASAAAVASSIGNAMTSDEVV